MLSLLDFFPQLLVSLATVIVEINESVHMASVSGQSLLALHVAQTILVLLAHCCSDYAQIDWFCLNSFHILLLCNLELGQISLQVDQTENLHLVLPHLELLHVFLLLRNHDLLYLVVVLRGHLVFDVARDFDMLFIVHQTIPVILTNC